MSKGTVIIQNVPKNHRRYTAARLVEGELWYMGSWDNRVIAKTACDDDMIVVDMGVEV